MKSSPAPNGRSGVSDMASALDEDAAATADNAAACMKPRLDAEGMADSGGVSPSPAEAQMKQDPS